MVKKLYEEIRDLEHSVSCTHYKNGSTDTHLHRSVEILAITSGSTTVTIGDKKYEAGAGDIIFIPSLFPHKVEKRDCNYYAFIISKPYLESFEQTYSNCHFGTMTDKEYNKAIFSVLESFDNCNDLIISGQTNLILGLIVKHYTPLRFENRANNLITDVIEYLEKNYEDDITLDSISQHFGYSKYYFSRFFNKSFGCTLNTYLNNLRVQKVKNFGFSKSDDILRCGFKTLSTYYRTVAKDKTK